MALAISDIKRTCQLLSDESKMNKFDYNKYKKLVSCLQNIFIQEEEDIYNIIRNIFSYTFECLTGMYFLLYYETTGFMVGTEILTDIRLFTPMNCNTCEFNKENYNMTLKQCIHFDLLRMLYNIPSFTRGVIDIITSFLPINNSCKSCTRVFINKHFKDFNYCDNCFRLKCKYCIPIKWLENTDSEWKGLNTAPYRKLKYRHCECWNVKQEEEQELKVINSSDIWSGDESSSVDFFDENNESDVEFVEIYGYGEFVLIEFRDKNI